MGEAVSVAERVALLPEAERRAAFAGLTEDQAHELLYDWRFWARPKQLAPAGDWSIWVLRAGRGFGKTRSGAGWVQGRAMAAQRWIALVARTPADARDYMIEGPGGLLKNAHPRERPVYEPSKRRVTWPNGSWATIYSDGEPEQLRGFSGDSGWLDELAKYRYPQAVWDNLQFGMREASTDQPRLIITTTPRPLTLLRRIEGLPGTVTVVGSSYENRANLDQKWLSDTIAQYEGTRFGRQEIHAEILDDVPGALWSRRNLDDYRVQSAPDLERIVVGLDPPATSGDGANEAGIVIAGVAKNRDGHTHGYTLDDWSIRGTPDEWGRRAVAAYRRYEADRIVAESNQGGEMVEHVIRSIDRDVPVTLVHATRGKYVRAEPISALYEQGRIHHVGALPELEDQMLGFTPESAADRSQGFSPDRTDSLVWAYSNLFSAITARVRDMDRPLPTRANSDYRPTAWRR